MKKLSIPDWFFFFLLIVLTMAFYKILSPYFIDIFLAVILAHVMRGVFSFLCNKLKFKQLAAALTVLAILLIIIIPIIVIGVILANELVKIYATIMISIPKAQVIIDKFSEIYFLQPLFESGLQINVMQELTNVLRGSAGNIVNLTSQILITISFNIFHLFIICFVIYFLYTDGDILIKKLMYLSPLDDKEEQRLINEVVNITDATLLGTMFVGVLEGIYGALIFYLFGIGSPVFWGVVIMLLSVIPIVGAIFVLVPAGIFLIVSGKWVVGLLVIVLAYVGTTITQSYIKPIFVSRRAGPHPAIIFLSTLGGLAWFGPVGFIIGPVFASLFIGVWNQFGKKYNRELELWNRGESADFEEVVPNDVY
ncbi:MAG: AI-2E family transporter [Candidatus Margulisbacteria bacterium]|nr:AI-2E family transporter [Candidatus Margulisiibacteriota bacterium]